jgi:hypothetical protein
VDAIMSNRECKRLEARWTSHIGWAIERGMHHGRRDNRWNERHVEISIDLPVAYTTQIHASSVVIGVKVPFSVTFADD